MDQLTGNFTAEGNVNSSRLPDKDQKKNSEMLSGRRAAAGQARQDGFGAIGTARSTMRATC